MFNITNILKKKYYGGCRRPDIPVGKLIDLSGFGSRTTYYKIKKALEQ